MRLLRLTRLILPALLLLAVTCSEWDDVPQAPCRGAGKIYGVVTGGSGPLAGSTVRVLSIDQSAWLDGETNSDGSYEVSVPPGKYFVALNAPSSNGIYYSSDGGATEWRSADTLQVSEGEGDTRADFHLGGLLLFLHVSPGDEAEGIRCTIQDPTGDRSYNYDYHYGSSGDSIVVFDFPAVIPGTYVLGIDRSNQTIWLPPTLDPGQADRVEIRRDETVFRSDTLSVPARVRGRVTGAWTLLGEGSVDAYLYGPDSTSDMSGREIASDYSFDLPVYAGGVVRVRVRASYGALMWVGGSSFNSATPFTIEPGATLDVGDIPTCGVRCTLVEVPGTEPGYWRADAFDDQNKSIGGAQSYEGSESVIPLARPTTARLVIRRTGSGIWKSQWYDRQVDFEHATPVTVSGPSELAEVSIRLERGGSISGRVVYQNDSPATGVEVRVRSEVSFADYLWVRAIDGNFAFKGLPDGEMELSAVVDGRYVYFYPGTVYQDSMETIPIANANEVAGLVFRLPTSSAASFLFVGANACRLCHQTEAQGRIYSVWGSSAHARAYTDLTATQQQNGVCLACHTTGYGRALAPGRDRTSLVAVQCEACHGPGSEYKALSVMKDPAKAARFGLITPDEGDCVVCHRGGLPRECWGGAGSSPDFDYAQASASIAHRIPG
jgi:hypothetical protein